MADFTAIKAFLTTTNSTTTPFLPKSEKPTKAVIRQLPIHTLAEDISNGLVDLGFDVVNVKQINTTRKSPEDGPRSEFLPLFLVTLPRTTKSTDLFKLTSMCHIRVQVEAYTARSTLMQCYNCQKFGHIWANCKQPPRCFRYLKRPCA